MMDDRAMLRDGQLWKELFVANLKSYLSRPWAAGWQALGMLVNNMIFFMVWIGFFAFAGDIRGWSLPDVAILFGFAALSFGLALFFFGGIRHLASMVEEGELDIWLSRPVNMLGPVLFRRCEPYAIGDVLTGILFAVTLGGLGLSELVSFLVIGVASALNLAFIYLAISSLSLWSRGKAGFIGTIHEIVIITGSMPLHGMPMMMKTVLFTILPAGFIAYLPAELIRSPGLGEALLYLGGSILIWVAGGQIFKKGMHRYASGGV